MGAGSHLNKAIPYNAARTICEQIYVGMRRVSAAMLDALQEKHNKIPQSAEAAIVQCCPKGSLCPRCSLAKQY